MAGSRPGPSGVAAARSARARDDLLEALGGGEEARAGVAGLAGVEVDRLEGAGDGGIDVGVGEDDVGRLAAELERDALEAPSGDGADLAPHGGGAGEGDLVDVGMGDERGAGGAVAGEDVDDARREADLERELAEAKRRERGLLGGLEHDGAAGGEGGRELPGGHQQGEVPGDHLRADADGFAAGVAVHPGAGGDGQDGALDLGGPAGEVAQVRGGSAHVDVLREADGLAVVERLDLGELPGVRFDREREVVHQALATGGGQL